MNTIGILLPTKRRKPSALLKAIHEQAIAHGRDAVLFREYQPCRTLILYGWGGVVQQQSIKKHRGKYAAFDLGYWDRDPGPEQKWRISINGFHCPKRIMHGDHPGLKRSAGITVAPQKSGGEGILLIGNGPKSVRVGARRWASDMCERLRQEFPGQKIMFRPKPERPAERGVRYDVLATGELKDELARASLVVCRHSNVAVDACIAGVPVVCDDGAGAAIYPTLKNWQDQPDIATRQEFIERVSYWQWSIDDVVRGDFWPWLRGQIET